MREDRFPANRSQDASSFLLRVWFEPGEAGDTEAPARGYLRNLQTGEERYIGTPEALTAVIQGQIRSLEQRPSARSKATQDTSREPASPSGFREETGSR